MCFTISYVSQRCQLCKEIVTKQVEHRHVLLYLCLLQWRIQDFPEGGREPSRGGVNTPNFPENCMKSKEFGRPGGGVRPSRPPLDPPMFCDIFVNLLKTLNIVLNL